jgi:hypothetical protein
LGATTAPPTILSSGMSWYLPLMMTEAGRRGRTMRFGIAVTSNKSKLNISFYL